MKKYTLQQFNKEYSDDNACLDKLYKLRFTDLVCPKCNSEKEFTRVNDRRSYQCPCCGFQVYPTAGTIFHKSTTPLKVWFHAIFMQTTTRNGVSAKELERTFDICYKTALRMSHQIKILLSNNTYGQLSGIVEIDECFIGGKARHSGNTYKKGNMKEQKAKGTYKIPKKTPVLGILERDGQIIARVVEDTKMETLHPVILANVEFGSNLMTDEYHAYKSLGSIYNHKTVKHSAGEYVRGDVYTNGIESFWSQLKRTIKGTHVQVTQRHLQKYVDEVIFRYENRNNQDQMFTLMLNRLAS